MIYNVKQLPVDRFQGAPAGCQPGFVVLWLQPGAEYAGFSGHSFVQEIDW